MSQPDLPEEQTNNPGGDQAASDNPGGNDKNLPNWDWLDSPGKVRLRVPAPLKNPEEKSGEPSAGETDEVMTGEPNPEQTTENAAAVPAAEEPVPATETPLEAGQSVPAPVEEQPAEPDSIVSAAVMETQSIQPAEEAADLEAAAPVEDVKEPELPALEALVQEVVASQDFPENTAADSEPANNPDIETLESKVEPAAVPAYVESDTRPIAARHVPPASLNQAVTGAGGGTTARSRMKSRVASTLPAAEKVVEEDKSTNPGSKLRAMEAAAPKKTGKPPLRFRLLQKGESTRRAAWDLAAVTSLIVNAVLIGIVILLAVQIRNLKTSLSGVLESLYGSIAQMDQAGVATTASVDTQIPLNFTLPIQQLTDVTLTQNVTVPGAYFLFNGSRVPVNVTLPEGMTLPISLNMSIPVQVTVPISLQVPVNIPLNQTQLHQPFLNLQNTLLPLVCIFDKNAQYPAGIYLCGENTDGATTTP